MKSTPKLQDMPRLDRVSEQMAADNARIATYLDVLPARVDAILTASRSSDWSALRQLSRQMAQWAAVTGCREVALRATALLELVEQQGDPTEVHRAVIRLVSICGRAQGPHRPRRPLAAPADRQTMGEVHGR